MASRNDGRGPHGILIVDKPSGPTSHDIVARARRHFGTRRVGHAGTLDPMATGVLVLLFGEATKLSDLATCRDKKYFAELTFGRSTDSHDADGATTEERQETPDWISEAALRDALAIELARDLQLPPVVSALKVDGQRAYRLSRAGTPPDLAPRPMRVHALKLLDWSPRYARIELLVSKGYYVRALVRDVARSLGVPAHLSQLRRLQSGDFSLAEACSWPPPEQTRPVPFATVLPRLLPTLRLTATGIERARCGQILKSEDFLDAPGAPSNSSEDTKNGALWAWVDMDGSPIAIGQRHAEGFCVKRGFAAGQAATLGDLNAATSSV